MLARTRYKNQSQKGDSSRDNEKLTRLRATLKGFSPATQKELSARINRYARFYGTDQAIEVWLQVLEVLERSKPCQAQKREG